MPRHPISTHSKQESMTEDHINLVARCSVPKTSMLNEVETATNSDKTLQGVRAAIKLNKWHYEVAKALKPCEGRTERQKQMCSSSRYKNSATTITPATSSRHCSRHPSWTKQNQSPYT